MAMIPFTQLVDHIKYPANIKAKLSSIHSDIINYVATNYDNRSSFRHIVCQTINTVTFRMISGDSFPKTWTSENPLQGLVLEDDSVLKYHLTKLQLYVDETNLIWDVEPSNSVSAECIEKSNIADRSVSVSNELTKKEDLYLQPPLVPRFDFNKPFVRRVVKNEVVQIYTSLPEIPTKQNEISVSTDVNKMNRNQLLSLFPNQFIPTRSPSMYHPVDGLSFDPILGLVFPISIFSEDDVRMNIIEYPHLFQLKRVVGEDVVNFYTSIELDEQLFSVYDIWDKLDDTKKLPKTPDFIKEYVVRRYILERDKGVVHKYPMLGSLDPFLTLFTCPAGYKELGVTTDPIELAKQCVRSRVSYKQSRNPLLRRLADE